MPRQPTNPTLIGSPCPAFFVASPPLAGTKRWRRDRQVVLIAFRRGATRAPRHPAREARGQRRLHEEGRSDGSERGCRHGAASRCAACGHRSERRMRQRACSGPRRRQRFARTAAPIARVPTRCFARARDVGGAQAVAQHRAHRVLDARRDVGALERVAEHHRRATGSSPADWPCPARRCPAPSRGSARTGPCRSRRATPRAACRSSPRASTPRRRGCRRTCCR